MNHNQTLTVHLTQDHLKALEAMVELGTADRREFLIRHAEENGWTDPQIAQGHYEADCAEDAISRLTAAADNSLLAGDIKTKRAPAPEKQTTEDEWVIYSPNEAATGNGGFWSINKGWVDQEDATRFAARMVDTYSLPQSLGQDRQWINLPLSGIRTEYELCDALSVFCGRESLTLKCATELRDDASLNNSKATFIWLDQFCRQWDAIIDSPT